MSRNTHSCAFRQDEWMEETDRISSNKDREGDHKRKEEWQGNDGVDGGRLMGEMVASQVFA